MSMAPRSGIFVNNDATSKETIKLPAVLMWFTLLANSNESINVNVANL